MARKPRTFASLRDTQRHVPVHTATPNTCGECGHLIGFTAESDPVHAVPRPCVGRCGTQLPPFQHECLSCFEARQVVLERQRQERLAEYTGADDGEHIPDRKPRGKGGGEVDPEAKRLYGEAVKYLREWNGTFPFLVDMKAKLDATSKYEQKLTTGQVAAVLKCKARDEERQAEGKRRLQTGLDLSSLPEGTTRYAVDNAEGEVTFIRVDRVVDGKWAGWVFVKQVVGGGVAGMDNEHRLGAQKPGDAYRGSFESLLRKVVEDPLAAARRYGLELGSCSDCGRTLTNPESREYGIGPKCRGKWSEAA